MRKLEVVIGWGRITLQARPVLVFPAYSQVRFFPRVPADVAHIDFAGGGVDREAERIAHAVKPHFGPDRVGPVIEGIVSGRAAVLPDAKNLPFQAVEVLSPKRVRIGE